MKALSTLNKAHLRLNAQGTEIVCPYLLKNLYDGP